MPPRSGEPGSRIEIIDALRGSALLGILLLHSIEHWDFLRAPDSTPAWLRPIDAATHQTAFFLFGGKAYGIFALMFGISFSIILERWSQRGIDFRSRFLWRLGVLGVFGYLHGIIYCGDILLVLAVLGIPLAFCTRLGNRAILAISVLLMLQLPSAWDAARVIFDAGYHPPTPRHWVIYGELEKVFATGSFFDVSAINLWRGQSARIWFTIETGRYLQMMGLFLWGVLIARSGALADPILAVRLGRRALAWGAAGFAVLFPIRLLLGRWGLRGMDQYVVDNWVGSYGNIAQMAFWVGAFVLVWQAAPARAVLRLLAPYGRMSLTSYVTQALVSVPLFYGYGLALYHGMGAFPSILYGAGLFIVQAAAARWWLARFHYGPLEWLWRACTFLDFTVPLRRAARPAATAPVAP